MSTAGPMVADLRAESDDLDAMADDRDGLPLAEEVLGDPEQVGIITEILGGATPREEESCVVRRIDVAEGDGRLDVIGRLLAGDVPLRAHHLGTDELADLTRAVASGPTRGARERVVESERLAGGHCRRDRDHAHVLHTAGDDEIHRSTEHRLRSKVHGLLR